MRSFPLSFVFILHLAPFIFAIPTSAAGMPPVVQETLPNGLRILILERHNSPTVAFRVCYDVGAVDDVPGKTGLAHFFEHMMFKGTKTLNSKNFSKEQAALDKVEAAADALTAEVSKPDPDPKRIQELQRAYEDAQRAADAWMEKDEYERILTEHGAQAFNAHTASDYTMYEVSLPANRLELWMAMESDRLLNPVLREFYREREVVMEERRMNYESRPDGKLWENFITHAFVAHPYHNEGIGWMSDLKRLTAQDARDFFAAHYVPSKTVIAIVGDVDSAKTLRLFRKYFGPIPARPPAPSRITQEPPQEGERRTVVRFPAEPKMLIGYHKPDIRHADQPVYEMIQAIMGLDEGAGIGRTTRFYKSLIEGKQLAQALDMDIRWPGQKYPGLVVISAVPRAPHTPEELEQGIYEELEKLKKDPIPKWELEKVANQLEARLVEKMESNEEMAELLAYHEAVAGGWQYPWKLKEAFAKVTEADIHRVARATFVPENRTVAVLLAPEKRTE